MRSIAERPAARRVAAALSAVVLFAGVVAVVTRTSGIGVGEGRLRASGNARVTSTDGRTTTVSGTVALHAGDIVEALSGTLAIDLPDGSQLEGRAGQAGDPGTKVQLQHPTELLAGELLVTTSGGTVVDAGGNAIRVAAGGDPSAVRINRSLAVGAGVYRGAADFDSAGQSRPLPALRQVEAPVLGRPAAVEALGVRTDDPWDRRFLGEAIDVGATLTRLANGYSSQFGPGAGQSVGFFEQVEPDLAREPQFDATLLTGVVAPSARPVRAPGDVLVGLTIARLGRQKTFAERVHDVFAFTDAGAAWGLVALDQGVASGPLLAAVQAAVTATPFTFAAGAVTGGANGTTPTTGATSPGTSGSPTTTTGGSSGGGSPTTPPPTSPTTTPPPTLPPVTPPPTLVPPTGSPLVDGLVNDVNSTIGGALGN